MCDRHLRARQLSCAAAPPLLAAAPSAHRVAACAQVHAALTEYFALDCEGTAGGAPTRFRYRAVPPVRDGLEVAEVLALSDAELNAIVGARKLAAYREDADRVRPNYKALAAARARLAAAGVSDPAARRAAPPRQRPRAVTSVARAPANDAATAVAGRRKPAAKRPGPALRRALKAAAAASETVAAESAAHVASVGAARPATPASAVPKQRDARQRWCALDPSEKKRLRMDAYARPAQTASATPAFPAPHASGRRTAQREPATQAREAPAADLAASSCAVAAGLPKSARKNLKRKLKRAEKCQADK